MTLYRRILRSRRGASLTETLVCVLILALMAGVIMTGSRTVARVYQAHTFVSESATVSDTINTALSDVLRYAGVTASGDGTVGAYSSSSYGVENAQLQIYNGEILLSADTGENEKRLLNTATYSGLYVVKPTFVVSDDISATVSRILSGTPETFTLSVEDGTVTGAYRLYDPFSGSLSEITAFSFRPMDGITVNS